MAEVSTPLPPSYSAPRSYPSLSDVSSALPTFVLAELIFFAVAVLALAHAWTRPDAHPNGRQRHVLLFVFAIIGGSLSDLFFVSVLRLPAFFTLLQLLSYLR